MNRRELLKAIPLAALAPEVMAEGANRYNLEPAGHFLFFIDSTKIDINDFAAMGLPNCPLLPKGSKGGWIVSVNGDIEDAVKIFRLDDETAKAIKEFGDA